MNLEQNRQQAEQFIRRLDSGLLAVVGPCANHDSDILRREGEQLAAITTDTLLPIHRIPHFKPRSNDNDWHGIVESDPELVRPLAEQEVRSHINIAVEVGCEAHVHEHEDLLTFAWTGARNINNMRLEPALATGEFARIPLGVKNGLDGSIDSALHKIERIERLRKEFSASAAVVALVFRGGHDLTTPKSWNDQFKRAFDATDGRFIVDIAHGSEMAHDPTGRFQKTIAGQQRCLDAVINLAGKGFMPSGVMIEASDFEHPDKHRRTDPNMPFADALIGVVELHNIMAGALL